MPNFPGNGSYGEYCAAKASQFAPKPTSLSFTEAAGVPLAALTAWTGLFAHGQVRAGQRVLIQGASGGVGGFAVQFAKARGAYVIGTASAGNLDYVRGLGADEALDYRTQPVEDLLRDVDVVLEASPLRDNAARVKAVRVLKEGGIFVNVNTDFPFDKAMQAALADQKVTGALAPNQARRDWLQEIAQLIDARQVKVTISKVYPIAQVADAHRESQTWHVQGKLVLEISPNGE